MGLFLKRWKKRSTSLQNSLFEHNSKSRSVSGRRKKTLNFAQKEPLRAQLCYCGHYAVTTVTTRSLRGHYAVTTRSLRGHYAVTAVTRTLCGQRAARSRLKRSTSLQNDLCDAKAAFSEGKNGSTSLQNVVSARLCPNGHNPPLRFSCWKNHLCQRKRDMGEGVVGPRSKTSQKAASSIQRE